MATFLNLMSIATFLDDMLNVFVRILHLHNVFRKQGRDDWPFDVWLNMSRSLIGVIVQMIQIREKQEKLWSMQMFTINVLFQFETNNIFKKYFT